MFQTIEIAAMLVSRTSPLRVELFSYANAFFLKNYFKLNKEAIFKRNKKKQFYILTCSKNWDRQEKFLL